RSAAGGRELHNKITSWRVMVLCDPEHLVVFDRCTLMVAATFTRWLACSREGNEDETELGMMNVRMVVACVLGITLGPHGLDGQTVARYRDFELKAGLAAVSALTGVAPSAARLIHQ